MFSFFFETRVPYGRLFRYWLNQVPIIVYPGNMCFDLNDVTCATEHITYVYYHPLTVERKPFPWHLQVLFVKLFILITSAMAFVVDWLYISRGSLFYISQMKILHSALLHLCIWTYYFIITNTNLIKNNIRIIAKKNFIIMATLVW